MNEAVTKLAPSIVVIIFLSKLSKPHYEKRSPHSKARAVMIPLRDQGCGDMEIFGEPLGYMIIVKFVSNVAFKVQ
jgi:hypothetical protein